MMRNPIRKKITDYEWDRHGFLRSFQGCGNTGTRFKRVITAVGYCEEEAYTHILEQVEQAERLELDWSEVGKSSSALSTQLWDGREETGIEVGVEVWFFLSLRYNLE